MRPFLPFFLLIAALLALPLALAGATTLTTKSILVVGDSLSAGYGLRPEEAWPSLLAGRLAGELAAKKRAIDYSVANLSISGETTAGGRSRLSEALKRSRPAIVIIELGANDGLRGLPLDPMRANLAAMITAAQQSGARVLLIGMRLPPNYGPYAEQFHATFADLARQHKTALLPFLLEPLATNRDLFQADGFHPTAAAQPLILDHVWSVLAPLLK